jgi:hypothetical protein
VPFVVRDNSRCRSHQDRAAQQDWQKPPLPGLDFFWVVWLIGLHRSNKTITATRQRFYETRILRRIAQDFPDLIYGGVQIVFDVNEGFRPKSLLEFLSSEDVARPF